MQETGSNYRIAAAVVMGGSSKRMGRPKENIVTGKDGRTLLHRICDEVDKCLGKCICGRYLSVRKGQCPDREGYIVLEDEYDGIGPLGGIISVLRRARSDGMDAVLMIAVDMPGYNDEEIVRICSAYAGEDILFARTGGKAVQPLASIYSTLMLDRAVFRAENGEYRLMALADGDIRSGFYDSRSDRAYLNVNRPEDLTDFENKYKEEEQL